MFPITHIYCIKKIVKESNSLHFLGSIFPDIGITGILNRKQTNFNGLILYYWFEKNFPNYKDFTLGYISHGSEPKGIDYYCDEDPLPREGYAFQKSKELVFELKNISGLSDFLSMIRAHNFIELAIEILIVKNNPVLLKNLEEARHKAKDVNLIAALSDFFHVDKNVLKKSLVEYFNLIPKHDNIDTTVKGLINIFHIRDKIIVDEEKIKALLVKAIDLVKETYINDLDIMINKTIPVIIGLKNK